ncbi:sugar O-acetyltransferase [Lactobacillus hominis]|uniref:Possible galactoside O-acetyltransferase n=1 Tax=Lactobacillus hominis DSM 23910 = CRBIP 24.179 TaxID=1423758 RepID=I7JUX2_9LACO|nr:sugar O-acetyltransferase [Lactobacillus hominis]KRM85647.1 galactoside O-acetyltransferase [Lactobacillus hominis DSM 23910 = CRBIP 24.179]MCT3347303.1 sugar O-acetyltransferase [Lactobacillus hominis]CCI81831.1 Possible galactoside O-acetyltransferase [Lactobacillus hominis DSM 23910 = CRBIP 24.179]
MEENTKNMLAGRPYRPDTDELSGFSSRAHRLCRDYNLTCDDDHLERKMIIDKLFPDHGQGVYLQGPIQIDYGRFTHLGDNFYANFNFTVLDTCPVNIGNNVMCGPNVTLATPLHPLTYQQRNSRMQDDGKIADIEYGAPITIGDNCWLASNVTVCAGVTIGSGCVIGAGAVVTKDMPDDSLVLGVPAKAVRKITADDRLDNYPY